MIWLGEKSLGMTLKRGTIYIILSMHTKYKLYLEEGQR